MLHKTDSLVSEGCSAGLKQEVSAQSLGHIVAYTRPIATHVTRIVVCLCVGLMVNCAKTAEPIDMPFR